MQSTLERLPSNHALYESEMRFKTLSAETVAGYRTAAERAFDSTFQSSGLSPAAYDALRKVFLSEAIGPWEGLIRRSRSK